MSVDQQKLNEQLAYLATADEEWARVTDMILEELAEEVEREAA